MKRLIIVCFIVCTAGVASVFSQNSRIERINNKTVNFGLRAGFNSSMCQVSDFKIDDMTIDDIHNTYKIGYLASAFLRLNFQKHYLQPEISYQISRYKITFDKLGSQHPEIEPDYASIGTKIHSLEVPVLYGYSIIKKGPYGMSVFAGPKFKYMWKNLNDITFDNFDQRNIKEELYPVNISLTFGVAVNISNIFFDFRYEEGLKNISKRVTYDNMENRETNRVVF